MSQHHVGPLQHIMIYGNGGHDGHDGSDGDDDSDDDGGDYGDDYGGKLPLAMMEMLMVTTLRWGSLEKGWETNAASLMTARLIFKK